MNPIVSFIKRQPLVSFFAISYVFTELGIAGNRPYRQTHGHAKVSERIAGAERPLIYLDLTQSRSKS